MPRKLDEPTAAHTTSIRLSPAGQVARGGRPMAMLPLASTYRIARKPHRCAHALWRQRVGEPAICSGTIEPGERYIDCAEHGDDPYRPARYHLACWDEEHRIFDATGAR